MLLLLLLLLLLLEDLLVLQKGQVSGALQLQQQQQGQVLRPHRQARHPQPPAAALSSRSCCWGR
jgi:hypothetical protein